MAEGGESEEPPKIEKEGADLECKMALKLGSNC